MSANSPTFSPKFSGATEAFAAAQYVEQLFTSELQWITHRITWLFVSQSFCITAYTILATSAIARNGFDAQRDVLRIGLPLLGIVCSVFVYCGVRAAGRVAEELADERSRLTAFINERYGVSIPRIGASKSMRDKSIHWTFFFGSLPQHLPLALIALWAFLLFKQW
jgi:hypothetical protein